MYSLNKDNPDFFNTEKLQSEFIRQASVCHGCRRCFNYCDAFPKMFKLTDGKGPKALSLEDLFDISKDCFHCNLCFVNCPYTPPHEFNMDFPHLMSWAWLYYRSKKGIPLKERFYEMLDYAGLVRPLAKQMVKTLESDDAPELKVSEEGFLSTAKPKEVQNPKAKVVLFHTCLVENFYPEIGNDLIEVYNKLGIEVKTAKFRCCGAPMLDVGDAVTLKNNAEYNFNLLKKFVEEGYDIISPIPTCTLMLTKEYKYILDKDPVKVYDAMEYLLKLKREGKIDIKGDLSKSIFYHTPCHLKYLGVGLPGVQLMRGVKGKIEIADKGCSGIDGGWGLRNYSKAKRIGSKMMEAFSESKADLLVTECPLAGLQIEKASGRKPLHPIQVIKEVMNNSDNSK
ncbi:heterodisulfide reductase-related iron-sulfur binding cluster [Acidianus manzaensis]|uniref:Glycerol-3-phosphate dehydrogenase n=1 Tax=Acidianus manzaensis TaxID=282676 RepID=A0A1W6JX12_9CREN|nr:heterodisulfide reductase-related iron-sulfur binding cluster [Acidianus manzaensis]ARM74787.1 glycerol-3-phosphate dehydrogenase [Acidianus manzaensis]